MKHFNGPERGGKAADEQSAKKGTHTKRATHKKKDWQAAEAVKQPKQTKREEPSGNSLLPPFPLLLKPPRKYSRWLQEEEKGRPSGEEEDFFYFSGGSYGGQANGEGTSAAALPQLFIARSAARARRRGIFLFYSSSSVFSGKMTDVYFLSPVRGGVGVPPPRDCLQRGERDSLLVRSSGQPTPHA